MKYRTFANYRDASQFARQQAMQHRRSVEVTRQGDAFLVPYIGGDVSPPRPTPDPRRTPPTETDWLERSLEEQRRREAEEAARRLAEDQRHEANRKRIQERRPYLLEREKYYRALYDGKLDQEWADRDENALEPDEMQLLRDIVRERKGIAPAYGKSVQVCRSCGQVGANCTCGRSWF